MRFGLFGSAQAKRGGPDVDSGGRLQGVRREQRRGRGARLSQHVPRRAPFHGLGQVSATLNLLTWVGGAHHDVAARHRGDRAGLAQSRPARRAGGDARPLVGRPARFRRRQGLPLQRVRRLRDADGGGRERFDESLAVHPQGVDLGRAVVAPRQATGSSKRRRRAAARPEAPSAPLDGARAAPARSRGCAARGDSLLLDQFACVEEIGERIALFRAEVEARGRMFDPMSVGVTRSINVTRRRTSSIARCRRASPAGGGSTGWRTGRTARP